MTPPIAIDTHMVLFYTYCAIYHLFHNVKTCYRVGGVSDPAL